MATNAPQDDWHKTGLRLPKELHRQLHEAAATSGRSYNAEIVARLEQTFTETVTEAGTPGLSRAVQELESLQRLGTLTYRLQRATYKADLLKPRLSQAWLNLQEAIKSGTKEEQQEAKSDHAALRKDLDRYTSKIEAIEAEISEIHHERKYSGLKELRDVEPVYAVVRSTWKDTGVVTHDASSKPSKPSKPTK